MGKAQNAHPVKGCNCCYNSNTIGQLPAHCAWGVLLVQSTESCSLAPVPCLQVKCCECGYESNTVDDFLHISLEITRAHSLTKALQRFTTGEYLDQENKYKCPKQV